MVTVSKQSEVMLFERDAAAAIKIQHAQNAVSFPVVEFTNMAAMCVCVYIYIYIYDCVSVWVYVCLCVCVDGYISAVCL